MITILNLEAQIKKKTGREPLDHEPFPHASIPYSLTPDLELHTLTQIPPTEQTRFLTPKLDSQHLDWLFNGLGWHISGLH